MKNLAREIYPDYIWLDTPISNEKAIRLYEKNGFRKMGNYYFTPAKGGDDVKVEYSFAYTKDKDGKLKIILHDSHLPYKPEVKH